MFEDLSVNLTVEHFLILGAIIFCIGLYGALAKRNVIAVLMSIELMLNAVNINLVAFANYLKPANTTGQVFALFVIAVAAAEAAIGLAIVIAVYRSHRTVNIEDVNLMKW
jgi:NADH:ubiquinone oxidoreductase subunit K